jgi:hypothetical protein
MLPEDGQVSESHFSIMPFLGSNGYSLATAASDAQQFPGEPC